MKKLHYKYSEKIFTPHRFVFHEKPEDVAQRAETQTNEAKEGISTALEGLDVPSAVRIAKERIDAVAKVELAKLQPDKETAKENKDYIERVLAAQKVAKEAIDKNLQV